MKQQEMSSQDTINYQRIATAIEYIKTHFKEQPNLDEVAEKVHLSPFHFQRLFTDWAGVSPKKFLQYLTVDYARQILKEKQTTLFDAAYETGLSGTGRLHDLFVKIEGMTPGEYKNGGEDLTIYYDFATTLFGKVIVAATAKGICHLAFCEDEQLALDILKERFPNAVYRQQSVSLHEDALRLLNRDHEATGEVKLHLKGTAFQLKVWEALLHIPAGRLTTYSGIAGLIDNPNAMRAVGSAIGDNPVAFLIPCHRVIQSGGTFGQYAWGTTRKTAMIGWEAAQAAD